MDVRIKLNETKDENEDLKIDDLVEELRKIVKIREQSGVQLKENFGEIKRFKEKRNYNSDTSGKSLATGATFVANDASKRNVCAFCLGKHVSSSCTKFAKTKERREVLQKYSKCFSCLQKGHRVKECRGAKLCSKCTKRKHHESLCDGEHDEKGTSEVCGVMNNKKAQEPSASVAYQTVIVNIQSQDGKCTIKFRALLDSGSSRSFITQQLADELQSKAIGPRMRKTFEGLNEKLQEVETEQHLVRMKSLDGKYCTQLAVSTLPAITKVGNPEPLLLKRKYTHLQDVYFTDVAKGDHLKIQMLLGSQHLADLQTGDIRKGKPGEPVAVRTMIGWTLMGPTKPDPAPGLKESVNLVIDTSHSVGEEVTKLWDLDTLGIKEDDPVHQAFQEEIKFKNGRYRVPLPWREGNFHVPQNKGLAEGCLKAQLRKMRKMPEILEEYDSIIKQQLDEGIIEPVPERPTGKRITYIPHQPVVREEAATTKVRVVYDASAKATKGVKSLNDCLHTGPSLTPLLYTVMLRFRMYKIVLLADIKQAFLQIEVDPEDRDALRFLWVKNPKDLNSPILEYRFTREVFGAGPSPYILGGTVRHHMEQYKAIDPEFVEDVNESLYVDDYVSGGDEKLEICERKQKLQERFEAGGFTLRKWYTNEKSIARKINDEPSNEERKVLGTIWDPGEDLLKINLAVPESQGPTTKPQLLSSLSAIYDPLELLAHL